MRLFTISRLLFGSALFAALAIGLSGLWILFRPGDADDKIGAHTALATKSISGQPSAQKQIAAPVIAGNEFNADAPRKVVIRALDKITMRMREFELDMNQSIRFGTLDISVRTCQATPPELPPENAAFVQVDDNRPGQPKTRVFSGWMFGSSPAVNGLEHPIYDVWVTACKMSFADKGPETVEVEAVSAVEKRGTGESMEGAIAADSASRPRRRAKVSGATTTQADSSESVPVTGSAAAPAAAPAAEPPAAAEPAPAQ
jgi:hypothetical protein